MKQLSNASIKVKDGSGNWNIVPGIAGESAYEIAVRRGYQGTEAQWLNALETERAAAVNDIQTAKANALSDIPQSYQELSDSVDDFKDNLVLIQTSQPNAEDNRLWIDSDDTSEVTVPTYAEFSQLSEEIRQDKTNYIELESGTYQDGNGTVKSSNSARIRNAYTVSVTGFSGIVVPTGYDIWIFRLDKDGTLISAVGSWLNGTVSFDTTLTSATKYINFGIRNSSTPSADISSEISTVENGLKLISVIDSAFDEIDELNEAVGTVVKTVQNESYSDALPVSRTSLTIGTGTTNVPIPNDTSLVKTFTAGKTYFAYAELTFANLSGYSAGYAYLQYSYAVSQNVISDYIAGGNAQSIANGKIKLYGFFTSVAGQSRPIITFRNTSVEYSVDITLDKLFLCESTEDYSSILSEIGNVKLINVADFPNESVGYYTLTQDLRKSFPAKDKTVIDCWGDSLTQGAGSTDYPYPTKLQALIGASATVNNYGQGSESAEDIAFRQGGIAAIIDPFAFETGEITAPITGRFINGQVFGNLNASGTYLGNGRVFVDNNPFMFRRGGTTGFYVGLQGDTSSTHAYDRPQLCVAEGKGVGHICLICIGQNGWVNSDPNTLADIINGMVEHNNSAYYIVIGRPTGDTSSRAAEESILATRFGGHFVNAREYISAYGLADNNLTPIADDETAMAAGAIPPTLKNDGTHLNDYGYIAMANCIYQRGKTLGYWD